MVWRHKNTELVHTKPTRRKPKLVFSVWLTSFLFLTDDNVIKTKHLSGLVDILVYKTLLIFTTTINNLASLKLFIFVKWGYKHVNQSKQSFTDWYPGQRTSPKRWDFCSAWYLKSFCADSHKPILTIWWSPYIRDIPCKHQWARVKGP